MGSGGSPASFVVRYGPVRQKKNSSTKKGVNVVLPCYLTNVHRPRSAGTVKDSR
jgi:hypothetical protein